MPIANDIARCSGQTDKQCCKECRRKDASTTERYWLFQGLIVNDKCFYRIAPDNEKLTNQKE